MDVKKITFLEIFILVVAIFAFGWMVNTEVEVVSAAGNCISPIATCDSESVLDLRCYPTTRTIQTCQNNQWISTTQCASDELCNIPTCTCEKFNNEDPPEDDGGSGIGRDLLVTGAGTAVRELGIGKRIWNGVKGILGIGGGGASSAASGPNIAGAFSTNPGIAAINAQEFGIVAPEAASQTGLGGFLGGPWGSALTSAAAAAGTALLINYIVGRVSSERNAQGMSTVTWVGAGAVGVWAILGAIGAVSGPPGWLAAAVVAVFAGLYMLFGYQLYSRHIFTFYSEMWQAPMEDYNCGHCNRLQIEGEGICSEYLCHSYGAACQWINDDTDYETCTEIGQGDHVPPVITPLREVYGEPVFPSEEFRYVATNAGARIIYDSSETQGCIPAFTSVIIAFETDENAHCKIGLEPNTERTPEEAFAVMKNLAEGSSFSINHTLTLPSSLTPSQISQEVAGYTLTNGGVYEFYIRCQDFRGNINDFDYSIGFCVHDIDLFPPEITGSNPEDDSYIPYDIDTIEQFQVYTNEPAICKWDFEQRAFDFMRFDFTHCSQNINDPIRGYQYGCEGVLTGFMQEQENTYYVACMDQPGLIGTAKEDQRNTGDAVPIILRGSQELIIEGVAINGQENNSIVLDSIEPVNVNLEVLTFAGANEGLAKCQHSNTGTDENDYAFFYNDGSTEYLNINTQPLYLSQGNYKYYVRCSDEAGNIATTMVNFTIDIDDTPPEIVRIYKQGNQLRLITDEVSECYYHTFSCIYDIDEEGTQMSTGDGKAHAVDWGIENDLYIKCKDEYGGRPGMDECSIIARPFEVIEVI